MADAKIQLSLAWKTSSRASAYRLQISEDVTFNTIVFEDSTISLTNKETGPLRSNTTYYWRILAKNDKGSSMWSRIWSFTTGINTSVKLIGSGTPAEFYLGNNYPNPFSNLTKIRYSLPVETYVTVTVFDDLGKEIAVLVKSNQIPGKYEVEFNGENLADGIYFYRLQAGNYSCTRKMKHHRLFPW
jgi:hypothetical protein